MKLTPELLAQAQSYINAVKERELDLRGFKIPAIENLGVTRDQHDAIDFTDNAIITLGNLPLLRRLRTLLLANNRIQTISPSIHLSVPNLTLLVLTNNNISELGDLEPLKELKHLTFLSLVGNPVQEKKYYREWLAYRIPSLRVLDFQKIRDKERNAAKSLFLTADKLPTALATTISTTVTTTTGKLSLTIDEPKAAPVKAGRLMSKADQEKVKAAIAKATSIEEVRRLERSLREGYLPDLDSVGA
ncbi:small nuclear ribonucleoprotein polypeptide A [Coprinopsis cinerea okayama7|uniref:U2 small nuclear ribonucleoprotein A' n=1 Tax=Coprinopsis cinerea (strain Okayama-7 / 130 / ATCC MYA-4618 / FGSC 9003) TaxID=240176 RepID=A8N187_COPC7|nr:small nuclear ribonucleoprotein polypeptide A [Coprinopsis cinerea okayama7\|eukprot:XP_001828636.1 small nuclear ribonucleoprotein polypeptide A [Coprinopsis cinerea okayama7\